MKKIRIAVIFKPGQKPKPIWFEWNNNKVTVEKINMVWQTEQGNTPYYHLSVSTDNGLFELILNKSDLTWTADQKTE